MQKLTTAILLGAISAGAIANEQGAPLQGSISAYAGLLSESKIKDPTAGLSDTADGSAFGLRGEIGNDLVFAYVDQQNASQDFTVALVPIDVDVTETRFGIGVRSDSPTVRWTGRLERYDLEMDLKVAGVKLSGDDDGVGVHLGLEADTSDRAFVYGSAGYFRLSDLSGPEFRAGMAGELADNVHLFGEYRLAMLDDSTTDLDLRDVRVGITFAF